MTLHKTIRLKPKEGRRARAGAPWIFSNEIQMDAAAKALAPGTIVNVACDDGQPLGTGYFNAKSLIAVRLLDSAINTIIGTGFFVRLLERAGAIRAALYEKPFYRLANAEGDGLPGLIIDRFDETVVVQTTTAGMENLIEPLKAALEKTIAPVNIILRNDTPSRVLEGLDDYVRAAKGAAQRIALEENGVRYFTDVAGGQKTGWYYDQRDNRAFMASLARGRSVLDAYSYCGGFGIAAATNGACEVICLDSSAAALALGEQAAAANGVACKFVKADVFEELERLAAAKETFDIVIADPPPFVRARKDLEPGAKAYRKLARLAASIVAPNGFLLLASCSYNISPERFAGECAQGIARAKRRCALIRQAGAAPDHPVHPLLPETAYLKALVYALD
ncbi:MAG TPA: class I SAM-dependent rRNA methyltransferase [Rhizomicrobium sp.]|nr:class I SAM-dependent rRNA methyltransferase [Rhizomicrobium sp.]